MPTLRPLIAGLLLALATAVGVGPAAAVGPPTELADPEFTPLPTTPPGEQEPTPQEPSDATDAAPQAAADQTTFAVAPAGPEGADGRVSFRLELEPGQAHTDHVEVTNYSAEDVTFALLASDGVVGESGAFDLLPSDVEPTDTGAWIDIEEEVALAAGESAVVPFTITVPEDALPGDHPGGIVASLSTTASGEDGGAVALDTRAGARVHLRVAGEITPSLGVAGLQIDYTPSWNPFEPGTVDMSWQLVNDGNVRLGAQQAAEIVGLLGIGGASTQIEGPREVLPRQSAAQSVSFEAWPTVRLGGEVRVTPAVVGSDDVEADLAASTASGAAWAVPWSQLVLVLLVAGLAVLLVRRRRRQRAELAAALAAAREEGARTSTSSALSANGAG